MVKHHSDATDTGHEMSTFPFVLSPSTHTNKTKTDFVPGMKVLGYEKSLLATLLGRGGQGKVNGILLKVLREPLAPACRASCLTLALPSTRRLRMG